jgi:Uma2 family endonuclease
MPETRRHLEVRTALYQSLKAAFRDVAVLGSEQFVFWDPTDPKACCAPDVMVRMGERDAPFDSWKVWERGAPHLAVEIISDSDASDKPWAAKLERYRKVGLRELVRFDADDPERPLRIWDFVEGELLERDPKAPDFSFSAVLAASFCVRVEHELGPTLRVARHPSGELYPTPEERVRELEAELARRGG